MLWLHSPSRRRARRTNLSLSRPRRLHHRMQHSQRPTYRIFSSLPALRRAFLCPLVHSSLFPRCRQLLTLRLSQA
jgi:hypothetical protein